MRPLGTRYIALTPIAEWQRSDEQGYAQAASDENGQPVVAYWMVHHNAKLYEKPGTARTQSNWNSRAHRNGRVLVVHLDDLEDLDDVADQQKHLEYVERQMLRWTAEYDRLRGEATLDAYELGRASREAKRR